MPNPHSGVNRLILSKTGGKDLKAYEREVLGNPTKSAAKYSKEKKNKKK